MNIDLTKDNNFNIKCPNGHENIKDLKEEKIIIVNKHFLVLVALKQFFYLINISNVFHLNLFVADIVKIVI